MYQCLISDFSKVLEKTESLCNLINKYGCSTYFKKYNVVLKQFMKPVTDAKTKATKNKLANFEIFNYSFNLRDYKVDKYVPIAIIEHNTVKNNKNVKNTINLFNSDNYKTIVDWYTIAGHCDDCDPKSYKKKTIMLLDTETNKYRQISITCFKKEFGSENYCIVQNFSSVCKILADYQNKLA